MSQRPHPGITMHKLSFGGGFVGLLFASGSALIFVLGFPTLWYFVAFAFGFGILIALFVRAVSRSRSERNRPPSILELPKQKEPLVFSQTAKIPRRFRADQQAAPA